MSAERERLAELLEEEQESGRWASSPTADLYGFMADAILAAGYRKPRTVTFEDAPNLAPQSVLMGRPLPNGTSNIYCVVDPEFEEVEGVYVMGLDAVQDFDIVDYPATVLYTPEPSA